MPSVSPAQARLMAAAAHTPGGFDGVPQSVGHDFNAADRGSPMLSQAMQKQRAQAMALRGQGQRPQGYGMPTQRPTGQRGFP